MKSGKFSKYSTYKMEKQKISKDVIARAKKIRLLLMDCDGVLTDGRIYFTDRGETMKVFHVRDGQGLVLWHQAGFNSGIISGRDSKEILAKRAAELGIKYIRVGSTDKTKDLIEILEDAQINLDEVAYIGDDVGDICLMEKVGLSIGVNDATPEVFKYVDYITHKKGGFGAVREVTDMLMAVKKQDIIHK